MKRIKNIAQLLNEDMFQIGGSLAAVNLSPGTLRNWEKLGLPLHRVGKRLVFASKKEVETFIKSGKFRPGTKAKIALKRAA